ncbi:MAG: PIN domain-containing protein [Actinomycetota bacterium]|nr:PIN domain-containing protein [Actinomycetota bacterium]
MLIGLLDASDRYHAASAAAVQDALNREDRLSVPVSALAEVLVAPAREGPAAVQRVRDLLFRLPIAVAVADEEVATLAAGLRAKHDAKHDAKLRLPDALVVATALRLGADVLVTTARGWPTGRALGLTGRLVTV